MYIYTHMSPNKRAWIKAGLKSSRTSNPNHCYGSIEHRTQVHFGWNQKIITCMWSIDQPAVEFKDYQRSSPQFWPPRTEDLSTVKYQTVDPWLSTMPQVSLLQFGQDPQPDPCERLMKENTRTTKIDRDLGWSSHASKLESDSINTN